MSTPTGPANVASVIWSRRRFFPRFVDLQLAIRKRNHVVPGPPPDRYSRRRAQSLNVDERRGR